MQPDLQAIPPPRVFRHSLDWRFLLPISDPAKLYVAFEDEPDFEAALDHVGVPVSNRRSFLSFKPGEESNIHVFALPLGLPVRWVSTGRDEQIESYRSIRRLLCPGGYFLLGFRNRWSSRSGNWSRYYSSRPRRVVDQLTRAGFKSVQVFGVMPNLQVPEYIFELSPQAMYFALQNRFRRKRVLSNGLRVLVWTVGLARISDFLPCYFAVAAV